MPSGTALQDVRRQLFDAAERVLVRGGAGALTSRAVTDEAGCAKGVLHRHFADFDAFLAELIEDRIARLEVQSAELHARAGSGDIAVNVTVALTSVFSSVAVAIVGLLVFRDGLRARLRAAGHQGVPVATQAGQMIAGYLAAERDLGRLAANADVDMIAGALVGGGHLMLAGTDLFADERDDADENLRKMVATTLEGAYR